MVPSYWILNTPRSTFAIAAATITATTVTAIIDEIKKFWFGNLWY